MPRPLRILIADDEPLAIRRLEIGLETTPAVEIVGRASDGEAALRAIAALAPDVVLLDIRMPGLDGLQVLESLDAARAPAVIFITAYSRFAVDAFKVAAVDYLLKPVEFERLAEALDRARDMLDARDARRGGKTGPEPPGAYPAEIWVNAGGARHRIATDSIEWVEAERDYVRIHTAGRAFLIRSSIQALADELDPAEFARVHRSTLVRLDQIVRLERVESGALSAVLRSGACVMVSRRHATAFRARFGPGS